MSISDTREIHDSYDVPPRDEVVHEPPIRPEEPRRNPMTYLALALATIALLLSLAALTRDNGPERVRVGNSDCVVVDGEDGGPDALYCNTTNVPNPTPAP